LLIEWCNKIQCIKQNFNFQHSLLLATEQPVYLVKKRNTILTPATDRGQKLTFPNTICNTCGQGCTNTVSKVARMTEFDTVALNTFGFSVWDWFHVTLLVPKISVWILDPRLREAILAPRPCSLKTLWDSPVGPENCTHEAGALFEECVVASRQCLREFKFSNPTRLSANM
jgi:hypothetical protein